MNQYINSSEKYQPLLDTLVRHGVLKDKDMLQAKRMMQEQQRSLVNVLVILGWVSEQRMADALVECSSYPLAEPADYHVEPTVDFQLSFRFMEHNNLIQTQSSSGHPLIVMSDPLDENIINAMAFAYDDVMPPIKIGLFGLISDAIDGVREAADKDKGVIEESRASNEDDVEYLKDLASEAPVIQFVNKIMQKAVEVGTSDIHVEPFDNSLKIRYRIDGVLSVEDVPNNCSPAAIVSRIKIMAKLDIAERRLPQDGRIMVRSHGKTLDVRVSTLPVVHGESVVMRILDRGDLELSFSALGLAPEVLNDFLKILAVPNGVILVTGPTGSGKSTTLYTAISHLNAPQVKIITVEDPVEYQLEGVNQLPVKTSIGLDFATALRSIVRQDPDIIMVGEMRDVETAKIAIQAALTGHLVLSTLHTNSASGAITRLLDMGVDNYLLISTINGILGQRLVRKLCVHCREPYAPSVEQIEMMGISLNSIPTLYRPSGCESCGQTGYSGRTMIVEWLPMTESLHSLIMANAGAGALQQRAIEQGMQTMFKDGLQKVLAGITCLDELLRVTQEG